MIGTINCVYETPCGWCSKWDKKCDNEIPERGQRAKCNPVDDVIDVTGESIKVVTNKTCESESDHEWECTGASTAGGITMDVKEKLVEQAISHFWYGVSHDIFSEPVTTYAKLAIEALEKENGITVQEWISVKDRLPDNKEYDWVLAQVVEDNGFMHIPTVMEYRQSRNDWFEETYGWLSDHNGLFTVTHWMPLPQPPKGE